jgi:hypothetical protein
VSALVRATALVAVALGSTAPLASAATPAATTRAYVGPAGVVAGTTVSSVKLDDDPSGAGAGGVMVILPAGRYTVAVLDASGRPVAAQITAFDTAGTGFVLTRCDATSVRTPALSGSSKVYVSPLVGACLDATGVTASAPTTGTVRITPA